MEVIVGAPLWRADLFECWGAAIGFGGILIQVLLVAAHMDNLEVAVDTARSLAPPLYEGGESNAPGDQLPTFYATFYDTESIM